MTNTLHLKDVVRSSQQKYSVNVSLRKMDELEEDYVYHLAEHYQAECKFQLAEADCAVADAEVRQAKANLSMLKARQTIGEHCPAERKLPLAIAICSVADAEVRQAKANLHMLKMRQVMSNVGASLNMAENKLEDLRFEDFIRDANEKRLALSAA